MTEHVEEVTARAFQEGFRKALRGNKFVKATGKPVPKRFHKYISDFNPKI
ncbi:hypothetical protein [Aquibium oceanicum]|nr:hypothetical protein [Aquibium oceanicum]